MLKTRTFAGCARGNLPPAGLFHVVMFWGGGTGEMSLIYALTVYSLTSEFRSSHLADPLPPIKDFCERCYYSFAFLNSFLF